MPSTKPRTAFASSSGASIAAWWPAPSSRTELIPDRAARDMVPAVKGPPPAPTASTGTVSPGDSDVPGAAVGDVGQCLPAEAGQSRLDGGEAEHVLRVGGASRTTSRH